MYFKLHATSATSPLCYYKRIFNVVTKKNWLTETTSAVKIFDLGIAAYDYNSPGMFQSEQIDFATIVTLLPDTNSELPDAARLIVSINPSFYTSNLFTVRDFPTD